MDNPFKPLFPSPLEVDRFISEREKGEHTMSKFPSPLEVDRFISEEAKRIYRRKVKKFPSPLEVDRFIS